MANVTAGNIQHFLTAGSAGGTAPAITINPGSGVYASIYSSPASAPTFALSDGLGNNYAAAGVHLAQFTNASSGAYVDRYYIPFGSVTSGSLALSYTAGGINIFDALITIVEVLNADSALLITNSNHRVTATTAPPQSSGSVTVGTPPTNGFLLMSGFGNDVDSAPPYTITEANGFSILYSNNGSGGAPVGAIGGLTVTSAGTYNASWSEGVSADRSLWIDVIPGAAAPPSNAAGPVPRCIFIMP